MDEPGLRRVSLMTRRLQVAVGIRTPPEVPQEPDAMFEAVVGNIRELNAEQRNGFYLRLRGRTGNDLTEADLARLKPGLAETANVVDIQVVRFKEDRWTQRQEVLVPRTAPTRLSSWEGLKNWWVEMGKDVVVLCPVNNRPRQLWLLKEPVYAGQPAIPDFFGGDGMRGPT